MCIRDRGENTKPFLLNIFIPRSLTNWFHSTSRSIPTSCSQVKSHDSEKGSGNTYPVANLYKIKTSYSPTGSSIGFSKVSPKPSSAQDGQSYQVLPASTIHTGYNFGLWKLSMSRCSFCCGYTFFSKTIFQVLLLCFSSRNFWIFNFWPLNRFYLNYELENPRVQA